jgi:hypothetical protein
MGAKWILREQSKREDEENIQQRLAKEGNKLHVARWVTWHEKCEKLIFYHDEEEYDEQPYRLVLSPFC